LEVLSVSSLNLHRSGNTTAYLLTLKRAGRWYAWSSMEANDPQTSLFLVDAFRLACRHAFGTWQWMVKKGYPVETAPDSGDEHHGPAYLVV
jgi:spore coat protein CotF